MFARNTDYIQTRKYDLDFERGDLIHITLKQNPRFVTPKDGKAVFVIEYERQNFREEFIVVDRHKDPTKRKYALGVIS